MLFRSQIPLCKNWTKEFCNRILFCQLACSSREERLLSVCMPVIPSNFWTTWERDFDDVKCQWVPSQWLSRYKREILVLHCAEIYSVSLQAYWRFSEDASSQEAKLCWFHCLQSWLLYCALFCFCLRVVFFKIKLWFPLLNFCCVASFSVYVVVAKYKKPQREPVW